MSKNKRPGGRPTPPPPTTPPVPTQPVAPPPPQPRIDQLLIGTEHKGDGAQITRPQLPSIERKGS